MEKLGSMLLMTLPAKLYDRQAIEAAFTAGGFAQDLLPPPGDPRDKFRVGVTKAVGDFAKANKKDTAGRRVKIRATDVNSNEHIVQKDIVQEIVRAKTVKGAAIDENGDPIDLHENSIIASIGKVVWRAKAPGDVKAKIGFNFTVPEAGNVSSVWADGVDYRPLVMQIVNTVSEMFSAITDVQLRAAIRRIVTHDLGARDASPIRGTYFVPVARQDRLDALLRALHAIDPAIFATAWSLYDEGTVAKDIGVFIQQDMLDGVKELEEEIAQVVADKSYTRSHKLGRFKTEIARFRDVATNGVYANMIDGKKVEAALLMAEQQLQMIEYNNRIEKEKAEAVKTAAKEVAKSARKMTKEEKAPRRGLFGEVA